MPQNLCVTAVSRARRVIHLPVPDGELVARFAASGDSDAFAQLVRRHGAMVLAVCRRVTRHQQDAEDAFQATFLVLARRAGAVNSTGAVAGWLFGVAVNAAREARKRAARWHRRESLVATLPEVGRCEPDPDFDTRAAVAEELAGLPEGYRSLVVACDLQGESQAAAARRLGLPVGTVYSRLSTARRILAERLGRRGFSAPACVAALAVFVADAGALPPVSDCPSPHVTELMEAIMKNRLSLRIKLAACVLLASVTMALGGEPPKPVPVVAPAPSVADESRIMIGFGGPVRFFKTDGTEASRLTGAEVVKAGAEMPTRSLSIALGSNTGLSAKVSEAFAPSGRAAPDGRLPLGTRKGLYLLTPGEPPVVKPVRAATGDGALFASGLVPHLVAWSPDGKRAVGRWCRQELFSAPRYEHVLIDLAAGTTTELKVPKNHHVVDWSPDGWFLTLCEELGGFFEGWSVKSQALCKVSADGKTSETLASYSFDGDWSRPGEWLQAAALSPDGKRVACSVATTVPFRVGAESAGRIGTKLCVLDPVERTRTLVVYEERGERIGDKGHDIIPFALRWSPDGSRIAFLCDHREFGPVRWTWWVGVVGANGGKMKTVYTSNSTDLPVPPPGHMLFDWR